MKEEEVSGMYMIYANQCTRTALRPFLQFPFRRDDLRPNAQMQLNALSGSLTGGRGRSAMNVTDLSLLLTICFIFNIKNILASETKEIKNSNKCLYDLSDIEKRFHVTTKVSDHLKVYINRELDAKDVSIETALPGHLANVSGTDLEKASSYLHIHTEYVTSKALRAILTSFNPYKNKDDKGLNENGVTSIYVTTPIHEQSDISISKNTYWWGNGAIFSITNHSSLEFSSTSSKTSKLAYKLSNTIKNCSKIAIAPEKDANNKAIPSNCMIYTPYFHGIHAHNIDKLQKDQIPPWEMKFKRKYLLTFVGSVYRYHDQRAHVVKSFIDSNSNKTNNSNKSSGSSGSKSQLNPKNPELITFYSPFILSTHSDEKAQGWGKDDFYIRIWHAYAYSHFSWHPHGDTATRRAFFDSWMFGCIPIIDRKAAYAYQKLYDGILFAANQQQGGYLEGIKQTSTQWKESTKRFIEDIVIVLPDNIMYDGDKVIAHLQSLSKEEIQCRRSRLRQLAPLLQWGEVSHHNHQHNAVDMFFASILPKTT